MNSINFVTCHDGFTLWDLVSYNEKHNEPNGEGNRDGSNDNFSWNGGAEGDADDAAIVRLRRQRAKNVLAILFLSQGVPMILAGDEVLRSQRGNNNVYCQDNEISWFDWRLVEENFEMLNFVRGLIALRRRHQSLRRRQFLTGRAKRGATLPDITWHGERVGEPQWQNDQARLLGFTLAGASAKEEALHVMLNMSDASCAVALPYPQRYRWHRVVDTSLAAPDDINSAPSHTAPVGERYTLQARSVVLFEGFGE